MARRKYSHRGKIKNRQPGYVKGLRSGMIVEFSYVGKDIFDRNPLILVLFNEYYTQRRRGKSVLIHGINLNYLNNAALKKFTGQLQDSRDIDTHKVVEGIKVTTEDPEDELETLPSRGLVKETHTQFTLPEFKYDFGKRHSLTRSEARLQMNLLYDKIIKRYLLSKFDAYRTYKIKSMKNIKILLFDI
jgi:hypothetical protein